LPRQVLFNQLFLSYIRIMFKKISFWKTLFVGAVFIFGAYSVSAFLTQDGVGEIIIKTPNVFVTREGRQIRVDMGKMTVKKDDIIHTDPSGKAMIELSTGDKLFLAPSSKINLSSTIIQNGMVKEKSFIIRIWGKIRAQIRKNSARQIQMKTVTSTIGIKGTDFIVEFKNEETTVGVITGLVEMTADQSGKNINIPPGKMSSVSPGGKLLPLSKFAGRLMQGVEFAGEQLKEDEFSGEKLEVR